jgi:predicted RNA binding protein YcfA (HicA-like mRNA interferase family)
MSLRVLSRDGWFVKRTSGAHVILQHPRKTGRVVVPTHRGQTLKLGLMHDILENAQLSVEEFRRLL